MKPKLIIIRLKVIAENVNSVNIFCLMYTII